MQRQRAVALAPGLEPHADGLGFAALTRIDISQAKAAFERAIALDSAEPLARLGLGLAMIRQSDLEAGGQGDRDRRGAGSDDSLIRSYLGKAYFAERREALAAGNTRSPRSSTRSIPPRFSTTRSHADQGRPGAALADIQRSIELNDNRAVYRSRLLLD